jgi:hypothetical protein
VASIKARSSSLNLVLCVEAGRTLSREELAALAEF